MKNLGVIVSLFLFSVSAHCGEAVIKPFGSLDWGDGLLDVIKKVSLIEGLEKMDFRLQSEWTAVPVKGVTNLSEFAELLLPVLEKEVPLAFGPGKRDEKTLKRSLESWIDMESREHTYLQMGSPYELTVEPILIEGVPFTMVINFRENKGFALKYPEKVIRIKGSTIEFPLMLTEVTLSSTSKLLKEKAKSISARLVAKYGELGRFDPLTGSEDWFGEATAKDETGGHIGAGYNGNENEYRIGYNNNNSREVKRLDDDYEKHLADMEEKSIKGKKDSASDL